MGRLKLWGLILAFPAIAITATLYCSSQNLPGCEQKQHKAGEAQQERKEPEVALSPIFLADNEQPKQAETDKRASQPSQQCPTVCRIVAKTFDDPVGFFTAVLCYVVLLQLIWMTRQEGVLRESVRVAGNAAAALPLIERAYVFVEINLAEELIHTPSGNAGTGIDVKYWNHGKTPAIITQIRGYPVIQKDTPLALGEGNESELPPSLGIATREAYRDRMTIRVSDVEFGELERREKTLFCVGRIEYLDVLNKKRETGFCWYLLIHGGKMRFIPSRDSPLNTRT